MLTIDSESEGSSLPVGSAAALVAELSFFELAFLPFFLFFSASA